MSYFSVKVCLLGDTNVGKSSLAQRFIDNSFDDTLPSTIGAAFLCKMVKTKRGSLYKINIWDTAGQERFKSLAPLYYRGAAVVLIVYNIAHRESLTCGAKEWIKNVRRNCPPNVVIALVGNKVDLDPIREVSADEALQFAKQTGAFFYETSAKTGLNIRKIFRDICTKFEMENNRHLTLVCDPGERKLRTISVISATGVQITPHNGPLSQCCET